MDPALVPDVWNLAEGIRASFDELLRAATEKDAKAAPARRSRKARSTGGAKKRAAKSSDEVNAA